MADWIRQQLHENAGQIEVDIELSPEAKTIEGIKMPDKLTVRFEFGQGNSQSRPKKKLYYNVIITFDGGEAQTFKNARATHIALNVVCNNKQKCPVDGVFLVKGVSLEAVLDRMCASGLV